MNINFLYHKFEALNSLVINNIDILIISETKLDDSFPTSEFLISGFSTPFRKDRNSHGGGLIIYIRENIPCKRLKAKVISNTIESIVIELKLVDTKWFLMGGYNPHRNNISNYLSQVSKEIDTYLCNYENLILIGDLNTPCQERPMKDF